MSTRIQRRNRGLILEAALDVFSSQGFRGATLDEIARAAGLSKPNLLYYFDSKEAIHRALLDDLLETWLEPLRAIDPMGDPQAEIMGYMRRKLQMARDFPRESRLFANEILQGAPRLGDFIAGELRALVEDRCHLIARWVAQGRLAPVDPLHLVLSIWSLTQHYADFDAQIRLIRSGTDPMAGADGFLDTLYARLLAPSAAQQGDTAAPPSSCVKYSGG